MELPPIVEKMYEANAWLLQKIGKFPKDHRYILGARIAGKGLDIQDNLIKAALLKKGDEKSALLNEVSVGMEQLRYLIRLSKDLRCINQDSWFYCSKNLMEIGKMLGGWIRSADA